MLAAGPNCESFYECRNGAVEEIPCPPGTLWNTIIDRCDLEENVNCADDGTLAPPVTVTTTPNPQPPITLVPTCGPTDNFLAAGPKCESFYECRNGAVEEIPCPPGTLWNTIIDRCDVEENVICEDEDTTTPPITQPTTIPTVTASPNPTVSPPLVTHMPDVEGALPIIFPGTDCPEGERAFAVHEFECRRFYYCLDGVRHPQTCPFLQKFDIIRGHCVPETDPELWCFNDL
ncbi:peritrophin-1-like [Anopheles darlingi]|uniref:peritrophin-1-like n=1 Tax=Anopheles darlingi TaxID=43151 RepID=UPI0020FFF86A|nr:peritrophin-1-like [Anopheles darlingi]